MSADKAKRGVFIDSPEFLGIQIYTAVSHPEMVGMNWSLSEECKKQLNAIDENIRTAKILGATIYVD